MKKKSQKKSINLRDRQEVLSLMKILYGNDEVKDDQVGNSNGESGAKGAREVVIPSSCAKRPVLQE